MDGETVFQLLCLPFEKQKEEIIKTYAYLLKKKRLNQKEGFPYFYCSHKEILEEFGHSASHERDYERMRGIFTILQGAGIIRFKTTMAEQKEDGTWRPEMMEIYEVNKKASDEWLGIKKD